MRGAAAPVRRSAPALRLGPALRRPRLDRLLGARPQDGHGSQRLGSQRARSPARHGGARRWAAAAALGE